MTRGDIAVVVLLIVTSLAMAFFALPRGEQAYAVVESGGAALYELPLEKDTAITVTADGGTNTISIRDGVVRITEADCPDKLCMRGSLGRSGGALVCLPHRLVVRVTAREAQWDAVTP